MNNNLLQSDSSTETASIAVMILAAGPSSRMGRPKQLLPDNHGQSMLRRAVETAFESICRPVVVVIGAHAEQLRDELNGVAVDIVENKEWVEGIGSSVRTGVEWLAFHYAPVAPAATVEATVIMLCDQPLITPEIINRLVQKYRESGKAIVASEYSNTRGVPALFSRHLFAELMCLGGNEGAKKIIAKYINEVVCISFSEGSTDIDTPLDYENFRAGKPRC
ncbi:MAG: nucleotidyltransferase family protein [Pyrinomonadaceae bacterium]